MARDKAAGQARRWRTRWRAASFHSKFFGLLCGDYKGEDDWTIKGALEVYVAGSDKKQGFSRLFSGVFNSLSTCLNLHCANLAFRPWTSPITLYLPVRLAPFFFPLTGSQVPKHKKSCTFIPHPCFAFLVYCPLNRMCQADARVPTGKTTLRARMLPDPGGQTRC